jgi:Fe-S-cluster-containing dehydrogenase component
MEKWNLIVDVAKCENCRNCELVTTDEHVGNDFPGYAAPQPLHGHRWIRIVRRVRGSAPMSDAAHLPTTCNHCDNAPCVKAARDGSVYQRPDGIVIIDPVKAKGRKDLVSSCPYGAIWWNEELQLPQKWIFDAHLLDQGWKRPRCEQVCPTGAIESLRTEDARMEEIARRDRLEVLQPELGTKPRVYYRNLYRFSACFIGGSVLVDVDGTVDVVEGAKIALSQNGKVIAQTVSDEFGDFRFDRLPPFSGRYRVEITADGFRLVSVDAELADDSSCVLAPLQLQPTASRPPIPA